MGGIIVADYHYDNQLIEITLVWLLWPFNGSKCQTCTKYQNIHIPRSLFMVVFPVANGADISTMI